MSINLRQTETTRQPSEIKNRAWCQGCGHYNVREEINCPKCGSFFIQERKVLNVQRPRIQMEVLTKDNERKEEISFESFISIFF